MTCVQKSNFEGLAKNKFPIVVQLKSTVVKSVLKIEKLDVDKYIAMVPFGR